MQATAPIVRRILIAWGVLWVLSFLTALGSGPGLSGWLELDPTALADLDSTSPDAPETGAHADAPRERLAPPSSFEALGRVTRPPPDPGVRHAGLLPGNAPLRL